MSPPPPQTNADRAHSRLNREHKETCETDWSDKVEAYNIDHTCARYHSQSTEVQFYPHSAKFEERWATSAAAPPRGPSSTPSPCPPNQEGPQLLAPPPGILQSPTGPEASRGGPSAVCSSAGSGAGSRPECPATHFTRGLRPRRKAGLGWSAASRARVWGTLGGVQGGRARGEGDKDAGSTCTEVTRERGGWGW